MLLLILRTLLPLIMLSACADYQEYDKRIVNVIILPMEVERQKILLGKE